MISSCVFNIPSQISNFICNFNNTTFPCKRLGKTWTFHRIQINRFFSRFYALLVNFTAMANQTVAHSISQIQRLFHTVGILKRFNVVSKKKTVSFVPEFFGSIVTLFLFQKFVQTIFSVVTKRCVSNIMPHCNGTGKLFIQP